jgi:hypothetical protein
MKFDRKIRVYEFDIYDDDGKWIGARWDSEVPPYGCGHPNEVQTGRSRLMVSAEVGVTIHDHFAPGTVGPRWDDVHSLIELYFKDRAWLVCDPRHKNYRTKPKIYRLVLDQEKEIPHAALTFREIKLG